MSSTSPAAHAGKLLGNRYELVDPIASGGMAQVWRGRDVSLDRPVAVKILHPHLATDQGFVVRFRREAVAAANLSHPSIVAVYDTLSEPGVEAIVMELIEGRTLRSVLDEVKLLAPADVVQVGMQIANALDTAHRSGVVHRDIKPANIMVGGDGRILVTDFGIAKANADEDLTHTGTLLGTAKYLAPEQVTGDPVDPRADLYALGVVLFEAATGQAPFAAATDAATALARLQQDTPHCRHRRPDVPVGLDAVIAKAMARDPAGRHERASALRDALASVDLTDIRADLADLPPPVIPGGPTTGGQPVVQPPGHTSPSGPMADPAPGSGSGSMPTPTGPTPMPPPAAPGWGAPDPTPTPMPPPTTPPVTGPISHPGTSVLPQPMGHTGGGTGSAGVPGAGDHSPSRKERKAEKKRARDRERRAEKQAKARRKAGRQRPTRTLAAVLIIGALVVAGLLVAASLNGRIGTAEAGDGTPLTIVGATPFDPLGSPPHGENNDLAPLAIDGDETTAWRSEGYFRPALGGLKAGVGLILELDGERALDGIELVSNSDGWRVEVHVGDDFGPNDAGFDPASLGEPVAVLEGGDRASASLGGATGSRVLLWITETGIPVDDDSRHRFELFEVVLR